MSTTQINFGNESYILSLIQELDNADEEIGLSNRADEAIAVVPAVKLIVATVPVAPALKETPNPSKPTIPFWRKKSSGSEKTFLQTKSLAEKKNLISDPISNCHVNKKSAALSSVQENQPAGIQAPTSVKRETSLVAKDSTLVKEECSSINNETLPAQVLPPPRFGSSFARAFSVRAPVKQQTPEQSPQKSLHRSGSILNVFQRSPTKKAPKEPQHKRMERYCTILACLLFIIINMVGQMIQAYQAPAATADLTKWSQAYLDSGKASLEDLEAILPYEDSDVLEKLLQQAHGDSTLAITIYMMTKKSKNGKTLGAKQ